MLRKVSRIVALGLVSVLLIPGVAYAIVDPDYVSIGDAYVFRNLLEDGDQLYFARYDVSYNVTQEEDSEDTWQMALYDSAGDLVATRPLNYYQHNIISIYLTASQAIAWEGAHSIRIMGMPSVFETLTEGVNMQTRVLAPGDYYEEESMGGILVTQAGILEEDWSITLLTSGYRLNTTGATYFTAAIPGLGSMAPEIFQTTVRDLDPEYTSYNQTYRQTLEDNEFVLNTTVDQTNLRRGVTNLGSYFGLSEGWSGFWLASIVYLLVVSVMYPPVGNPGWALIAGFPILGGAAFIGLGTEMLTMFVVLVLVAALIFGIYFILGRFA